MTEYFDQNPGYITRSKRLKTTTIVNDHNQNERLKMMKKQLQEAMDYLKRCEVRLLQIRYELICLRSLSRMREVVIDEFAILNLNAICLKHTNELEHD
jgi:hypothetical protein